MEFITYSEFGDMPIRHHAKLERAITKKMLSEFNDIPTPEPPPLIPEWKKIFREGPKPRERDPDRVSMYSAKCNYHMTVKEISQHFNVAPVTIDRIVAGALEKLRATLHEETGITDRLKLMRSMLFFKEDTKNYFNPNSPGGLVWHTLKEMPDIAF